MPQLRISNEEYMRRRNTLFSRLADRDVDALVLFGPNNVSYLTAFGFIPTERPMAAVITPDSAAVLVPQLEKEHAEEFALVERVDTYPEYPDVRHPMEFMKDLLVDLGLENSTIGVDSEGYGQIYGYRGPRIPDLLPDAKLVNILDDIEYMQMINSEEELNLIRESCRWGNLAHTYLQEYCEVGVSETEISMRASFEATRAMIRTLGSEYRPLVFGNSTAMAGFRGQVGKASAMPHSMTSGVKLQAGDVLVTGANASVWGYGSELERTMIMGEPTDRQATLFNHMLEAQTLALNMLKPGRPCSDVDNAVREYFRDQRIEHMWRHHTGHAKSTLIHEAPFLDVGDDRLMEVGMVFTVEPGVYVPDFAGFRHSDTVAVTEDGFEWLTYYPRDLESMTIPI
ncbi:MAG: aminopeptidase P family protein [Sphaerobacteraceae bacterium]|nr:MAG: aminopeptidase P family protein [Sphaerobacteraceae bacterium]